jgi:hypothetical protein
MLSQQQTAKKKEAFGIVVKYPLLQCVLVPGTSHTACQVHLGMRDEEESRGFPSILFLPGANLRAIASRPRVPDSWPLALRRRESHIDLRRTAKLSVRVQDGAVCNLP